MAGTIAALKDGSQGVLGVTSSTSLHIVKVFHGEGCGWSYSSGLIGALEECESVGSNIVSMSLGGTVQSQAEKTAFNDAYGRGVLSIAAAGNDVSFIV